MLGFSSYACRFTIAIRQNFSIFCVTFIKIINVDDSNKRVYWKKIFGKRCKRLLHVWFIALIFVLCLGLQLYSVRRAGSSAMADSCLVPNCDIALNRSTSDLSTSILLPTSFHVYTSIKKDIAQMKAKRYAPPVSATSGGGTATLISGFDFRYGFSC